MRDTKFKTTAGVEMEQKMQRTIRVDGVEKSVQKGIKSILTERGLWHDKLVLDCPRKTGGCDLSNIPVNVEMELMDDELVRMRAAERAAAETAHQLLVVQDAADLRIAVADAAANPIPAEVPEGVEPFSMYTVIAGAASTTRTQFTHSNTACEQCDEAESDTRKFERCERCNIVYHRTCLQPQIQLPPGTYVFLCDFPECRNEWDALTADPN